jgi:hypothetical protein
MPIFTTIVTFGGPWGTKNGTKFYSLRHWGFYLLSVLPLFTFSFFLFFLHPSSFFFPPSSFIIFPISAFLFFPSFLFLLSFSLFALQNPLAASLRLLVMLSFYILMSSPLSGLESSSRRLTLSWKNGNNAVGGK